MNRLAPRMALGDRLKTIAVTALVTSIAWIVFGAGVMDGVGNLAMVRKEGSAEPAGEPTVAAREAGPRSSAVAPPSTGLGAVASAGKDGYLIPVAGIASNQLSDTFTAARGGGSRVHDAIDIMAPRGTPVIAAVGGTVEKLFTSKPGGLTIYVRSPDRRTISYYAHLDAYAPGLAEGQQVRAGQQLGTVGFTGNASPDAPHLHFAVMETTPDANWWDPATAINPYPLLTGRGR